MACHVNKSDTGRTCLDQHITKKYTSNFSNSVQKCCNEKEKEEKKKKSNFKAFCVTRKCKNNKNGYCKAFCVTRKHAINSQLALNCFSDERLD